VAGLLHDIGLLVIAISLSQQYVEIQELFERGEGSYDEVELSVLGLRHSDYSSATLEKWNLPTAIQTAVRFHHHPDESPEDATKGLTLSRVLYASDAIVKKLGISIHPEKDTASAEEAMAILEELGLGAKSERILENFQKEFDVIKNVF